MPLMEMTLGQKRVKPFAYLSAMAHTI